MKQNALIPPDPKQCQRMVQTGCWPDAEHFMVLGPPQLHRCPGKPVAIVYETLPRDDGLKGSMSLCGPCLAECLEAFPPGAIRVERIGSYDEKT